MHLQSITGDYQDPEEQFTYSQDSIFSSFGNESSPDFRGRILVMDIDVPSNETYSSTIFGLRINEGSTPIDTFSATNCENVSGVTCADIRQVSISSEIDSPDTISFSISADNSIHNAINTTLEVSIK